MSTDANIAILKDAYTKWESTRGGSIDHWMSIIDPNIKFGSLAQGADVMSFAKDYTSRDQLREYFNGLSSGWTMVHYTMNEYIAQDDKVVVRGSCAWTNKQTGKTMETPKVDFWRLRDGKIVEYYEYYDTAAVFAAAS